MKNSIRRNQFRSLHACSIVGFVGLLFLCTVPTASGQTASPFPQASTGDSVQFTAQMWSLMTLRDLPQFMDDKYLLPFATAQVSAEQGAWVNLGPQTGPGGGAGIIPAQITYEWQKLIDEQPDFAGGQLLDVFLSNNPSWSFLDRNPKWIPKSADPPYVEAFLFSKDKIEKRTADAAARELMPVVKRNFQMAIKKLPAHYYFTEMLPVTRYDAAAKGLRIITDRGPVDGFDLLFAMVNTLQGSGKDMAEYAIGGILTTALPKEVYPGKNAPYDNSPEWDWKQN